MKLFKYFFVGAAAAAVDIGLFFIFVRMLGFPWFTVSIITFVLATVVNYLLSIHFVFESGKKYSKRMEIVGVFVVSGLALIVHQLVLYVLIEWLYWHPVISKCAATGVVFFWNYFGRSRFLFAR